MARGSEAKASITEQILNNFEGSFIASDGKTLRIPMVENGEVIEIKVTLVAAKDLERGTSSNQLDDIDNESDNSCDIAALDVPEPTEEEKERINKLLASLNM